MGRNTVWEKIQVSYKENGESLPKTPVLSESEDILYWYPRNLETKICSVPHSVKKICEHVFECAGYEEVILPEGLEVIKTGAFYASKIKKITLPSTLRKVEKSAFESCAELEEVTLLCDSGVLDTKAFDRCKKVCIKGAELDSGEYRRILGHKIFFIDENLKLPKTSLWNNQLFVSFVKRCEKGNPQAMLELGNYFGQLERTEGDPKFYQLASNFWKIRAAEYKHPEAVRWKKEWFLKNPEGLMPMVLLPDGGAADGNVLQALGFRFFDPNRYYHFMEKTAGGIVEVYSWCDTDGSDEDGYGREVYYDFWFLDEFWNEIPGVGSMRGYSLRERHLRDPGGFLEKHKQAQSILNRKRRQRKFSAGNMFGIRRR